MSYLTVLRKMSGGLAVAFVSVMVGGQAVLAAEVMPNNSPANSSLLIANNYSDRCEYDDLLEGDGVLIDGEIYPVEIDEDGLFISYMVVDEDGNEVGDGTVSIKQFAYDCTTVYLEQVEGIDILATDTETETEIDHEAIDHEAIDD